MDWTDWFTGKGSGLTDAEYAAKRRSEAAANKKEQDRVLARRAADQKVRTAANTPTQQERDLQRARNTRIDRLTPDQKRLIVQGTPDPAGQPAKKETSPKPKNRQQVSSQTNKPTAPKNEYPKPSTEPLPPSSEDLVRENVNQRNRVSSQGVGTTQFFDINSFRAELAENDVLPAHSYLVTFAPFRMGFDENIPLTQFVTQKRNTLVLRCESVILPTPSLLEEENIRRYGYGPVEKVPYGVQFSDVSITWLVDKRAEIIDFMHQWMNTIVMHDSPNALMNPGTTRPGLDRYLPFEVGFKDAYANPIVRVYVYNRQNQTVTEYELYDVFPMNIQSMNLNWADENQLQKLTVTFAYTNMRVSTPLTTTEEQLNYILESRTPANEEKKQPNDKGGKAAADKKDSPVGESIKKTAQSSNPAIKSGASKAIAVVASAAPVVRNIA